MANFRWVGLKRLDVVVMLMVATCSGACDSATTNSGAGCIGKERCACYGNKTCDSPFVCLSDTCVAPDGTPTPGAAGAASAYTEQPAHAGSPAVEGGAVAGAEAILGIGGWGTIPGASGAPAIFTFGGSPAIGEGGAPPVTGLGGAPVVGLGGAPNGGASIVENGGTVVTGNGGAPVTASGGMVTTASGGKVGSGGASTLVGRGGTNASGGSVATVIPRGGTSAYGGSSSSLPTGPNLIKDPTFQQVSSSGYWNATLNAGDSGTVATSTDGVCFTNTSTDPMNIQLALTLGYPNLAADALVIEPGATYVLSYVVKATYLYEWEAKVGHTEEPWDAVYSNTTDDLSITSSFKTFTHQFSSTLGDTSAGVAFNPVLDEGGKICFQQVSLAKVLR